MQNNHDDPAKSLTRTRLARTRFVGMKPTEQVIDPLSTTGSLRAQRAAADQPTSITRPQLPSVEKVVSAHLPSIFQQGNQLAPAENRETAHLLQLSGMMRSVRTSTQPLVETDEDGYWPLGIQQVGPLIVKNLYGREPFGRIYPQAVPLVTPRSDEHFRVPWQNALNTIALRMSLGALIGLGLFFLTWPFVNLSRAMAILGTHLGTAQGIALLIFAGIVYLVGRTIRALRWKLFLDPFGNLWTFSVIKLYHIATFLNFFLPIHAGEAAKSLALKQIANVPISKSLPSVAMDKALDCLLALVIIPLVPILGASMNPQLWLVFALGCAILLSLIIFTCLRVWRRDFALSLLRKILWPLPGTISSKIESFITGFVDALLVGAANPGIFLLTVLLTCAALACDTFFVLLAFWTIGFSLGFGTALFALVVCGIFAILPLPPGQLGSAELVGLLIFSGLLRLPGESVAAAYILFHLWIALVLAATGLGCLASLDLKVFRILHIQDEGK
jgi:uncharacterized protein (TIRG00374 family)